jgi:glycosyltransferase involved in cell wall biosynthesis
VAVVSFDDVPPIGGQGRYVAALEKEMPSEGYEVSMITPRRGPWGPTPKIRRRTKRPPLDFSLFLRSRLGQVSEAVRPALWHFQGGPGGVLLRQHPPDAPLVYTSHHTYRTAHGRHIGTMPMAHFEARGYRLAERIIAVSQSTASSLVNDYKVNRDAISVIPAGVDTRWLSPPPPGSERNTVLFVGRLVPNKGVQYFVAMFRSLAKEYPNLVAEVCGEGILYDAALSAAASLDGRLRMLGRVSDEELREAYRRARLFVMPSKYEGLGLVALEAMACGTPVVGLDVPGLRDLRETGISLVRPGDQQALYEQVSQLLSEDARWGELSEQALEAVRINYAWEVVRTRIAEIYRSVLPSSSTHAP